MARANEVVPQIIAKIAKCDTADLVPETRLAEDLGIKSLSRIEIAAMIEDELGVALSNFDIRRPKSVGDVVQLVEGKL
jgi:acyl carrier protein